MDVTDHRWQTETGWAITANPRGVEDIDVEQGSAGVPMPGFRVRVADSAGTTLHSGSEGIIARSRPRARRGRAGAARRHLG